MSPLETVDGDNVEYVVGRLFEVTAHCREWTHIVDVEECAFCCDPSCSSCNSDYSNFPAVADGCSSSVVSGSWLNGYTESADAIITNTGSANSRGGQFSVTVSVGLVGGSPSEWHMYAQNDTSGDYVRIRYGWSTRDDDAWRHAGCISLMRNGAVVSDSPGNDVPNVGSDVHGLMHGEQVFATQSNLGVSSLFYVRLRAGEEGSYAPGVGTGSDPDWSQDYPTPGDNSAMLLFGATWEKPVTGPAFCSNWLPSCSIYFYSTTGVFFGDPQDNQYDPVGYKQTGCWCTTVSGEWHLQHGGFFQPFGLVTNEGGWLRWNTVHPSWRISGYAEVSQPLNWPTHDKVMVSWDMNAGGAPTSYVEVQDLGPSDFPASEVRECYGDERTREVIFRLILGGATVATSDIVHVNLGEFGEIGYYVCVGENRIRVSVDTSCGFITVIQYDSPYSGTGGSATCKWGLGLGPIDAGEIPSIPGYDPDEPLDVIGVPAGRMTLFHSYETSPRDCWTDGPTYNSCQRCAIPHCPSVCPERSGMPEYLMFEIEGIVNGDDSIQVCDDDGDCPALDGIYLMPAGWGIQGDLLDDGFCGYSYQIEPGTGGICAMHFGAFQVWFIYDEVSPGVFQVMMILNLNWYFGGGSCCGPGTAPLHVEWVRTEPTWCNIDEVVLTQTAFSAGSTVPCDFTGATVTVTGIYATAA